ncbi:MAG TPA: hypothetical protein VFH66_16745 [Mycobacteriales bacterium]|nr:hypothetical protein [Mycobacteriales bacterium]
MTPALAPTAPISDEHSVLLWQTCAYAEDLGDAARFRRRLTPAYDAMLEFLHYRLLPYLNNEERQLPAARLRDDHLLQVLIADHERLRADVDNIEGSRTRRLIAMATGALVERLERHVRREESWLTDPVGDTTQADLQDWSLPLLFSDVVDLDALPAEHRDALVRQRLAWMRPGDDVRLEASTDLHPLWRRQCASDHNAQVWVYEEDGPTRWRARVTRRDIEDC